MRKDEVFRRNSSNGFITGSIISGLNTPADGGYELLRELSATGEETLMDEILCFTSELYTFFIAGTKKSVVLFGSTKTSFPTAMASI